MKKASFFLLLFLMASTFFSCKYGYISGVKYNKGYKGNLYLKDNIVKKINYIKKDSLEIVQIIDTLNLVKSNDTISSYSDNIITHKLKSNDSQIKKKLIQNIQLFSNKLNKNTKIRKFTTGINQNFNNNSHLARISDQKDGFAITSLVLGILSPFLLLGTASLGAIDLVLCILTSLGAIIFGILGLNSDKKSLAITGLIVGIGVICFVLGFYIYLLFHPIIL